MKKLFIFASMVGLAAGVVYWLYKKGNSNTVTSKTAGKKEDFESYTQEEEIFRDTGNEEKMYQAKNEIAQNVCERHLEAGFIMKDAHSNIMENFVEDFSSENDMNTKDENKEIINDSKSALIMNEIDSISDEVDDLLK